MNIFTYGSLMFPEVWTRVVRGAYRQSSASVAGYRCFTVRGEVYPGLVTATELPDCSVYRVDGILYFNVDEGDVAALDRFEGDDYRRLEVAVELPDSTVVSAFAYLYLPVEKLTDAPWSAAAFELQRFFTRYCDARNPAGDAG